jgi:hypothetical protein
MTAPYKVGNTVILGSDLSRGMCVKPIFYMLDCPQWHHDSDGSIAVQGFEFGIKFELEELGQVN